MQLSRASNGAVFNEALLPEGQKRWGSFSAGVVIQVVALAIVLVIPALAAPAAQYRAALLGHAARVPPHRSVETAAAAEASAGKTNRRERSAETR